MNKRSLVNLFLLIVVVLLAAGAWFTSDNKTAPAKSPLLLLPAANITLIEIKKPDTPLIRLEKQNSQWQLVLPYPAPVNKTTMQEFLNALHADTQESYASNEVDLAAMGFETPGLQITVNGTTRLVFGGVSPIHYQRYIKIGDRIKLIEGVDYYPLAVTADALAEKQKTKPTTGNTGNTEKKQ